MRAIVARWEKHDTDQDNEGLESNIKQIMPYRGCLLCVTLLSSVVSDEHNTQRSALSKIVCPEPW